MRSCRWTFRFFHSWLLCYSEHSGTCIFDFRCPLDVCPEVGLLDHIVCAKLLHVRLFATPWTVAHEAALSMGFSRLEYWSGLPCPSPGDFLDPGIEPVSPIAPALQADCLPLSHLGSWIIW